MRGGLPAQGRHYKDDTVMKLSLPRAVMAAAAFAALPPAAMAAPTAEARYFAFEASGFPTRQPHEFIVRIDDPATAALAERILLGHEQRETRILGTVIKGRAGYNEAWPFHLDPQSIQFSGNATEVCDATSLYVEENLHLLGTDFLPRNEWCPWTARLTREVAYP
jgi:hypothetical protein